MSTILGPGSRIRHFEHGDGVVVQSGLTVYTVSFHKTGMRDVPTDDPLITVVERIASPENNVNLAEVERRLMFILKQWSDVTEIVPLGQRWAGGTMILKPGEKDLAAKEVPIESFFHKIVMLRDRLRVLEQKVNASKGLTDEEKVDIQQYITRCYGTLTTFNVLFKDKEHYFVGQKEN